LHVRLTLPTGVHVYAPPVPHGYQALSVELEPLDGLLVGELALPAARPFNVAGLDEDFVVYEERVEATLPFMLTRNLGATRGRRALPGMYRDRVLTAHQHPPADRSRRSGSHSRLIGADAGHTAASFKPLDGER
jgi:hypothetical protein